MIFLHGYLSSSDSFVYQTNFFEKDFVCHAVDLKGFGNNAGMPYPYSLDDYICDVDKYMKESGIVRPHVIAHSFGARIALKMAFQNPDVFDKLVLTGAAGLKPKRTVKYYIKKACFKVAKPFLFGRKPKIFYSSDYLALDSVMRQSFAKIIGETLDYTLSGIENKTLLIFGKNDLETPVYMAKRFKTGIKNSELKIYENAGHFCFIDAPQKFNWEVREFLLSND